MRKFIIFVLLTIVLLGTLAACAGKDHENACKWPRHRQRGITFERGGVTP